jgi:hypothetical protein
MSLPNWPGADEVYRRCNQINAARCASDYQAFFIACKKRGRKAAGRWSPPQEVLEIIEAMNAGEEETLKAYALANITVWAPRRRPADAQAAPS